MFSTICRFESIIFCETVKIFSKKFILYYTQIYRNSLKQIVKQNSLRNSFMDIADRIKELRGKMTREQFAEITDIPAQTLYKYEKRTGKVSLDSVEIGRAHV